MADPNVPGSLSGDTVLYFHHDRSGTLWVGTNGGLNRFNEETSTFHPFTIEDGLPNNVINAILEDDQGHLWLSTNRGLSRFNPQTHSFRNYDVADGLQSYEFNTSSCVKTRSGEMFFGGINGFNAFYPHDIVDNPYPPAVVLTGLEVFNRPVTVGQQVEGQVLLPHSITTIQEIHLSYKHTVFSLKYAALHYAAPGKNRYAYKMEGLEKEWNRVENRRLATYTFLPPGKYVFHVKGTNNDDIWNEEGTSVSIIVSPPFWKTWWFQLLLLLMLSIIIAVGFKLRIKSIREREEKSHLERELKLKKDFTAMLVHDLGGPLNCIVGYSDLLRKNPHKDNVDKTTGIILHAANDMLHLIDDMLSLSRFEAGKMALNKKMHSLNRLVEDSLLLTKPLLDQKSLSLIPDIDVLPPISLDPVRIGQVIHNLLGNAIKFSPEKGKIIISVKSLVIDDKKYHELSIADEGLGVRLEDRQHLFSMYTTLKTEDNKILKGTGLGLAVSRFIIEAHQGVIGYQPGESQGSTFFFRIPAVTTKI